MKGSCVRKDSNCRGRRGKLAEIAVALVVLLLGGFAAAQELALPEEKHLENVRQLTFSGENAEAYFSADDKQLIFQRADGGIPCDQIFVLPVDAPAGTNPKMVSNGRGKTTCSYFFPDGKRILYSSTHEASPECPPKPDYSKGYIWAIYPGFDIYTAKPDGSGLKRLTSTPGYDAEATIRRDGKKIVFTSTRGGDLDLYTMDASGRNVRRLTTELGYEGGAFFSADGRKIVYRAYHPKTEKQIAEYKELLRENAIKPANFEIWVMDADGRNQRQVTRNGAANFGPFFHPDGKRIIFASNLANPRGRNFDLYMVNVDGSGLERITFSPEFDAFPMFSSDGKRLVWASNRKGAKPGDTNVFLADWVE